MMDAPNKIWIYPDLFEEVSICKCMNYDVQYIRADLVDELVEAAFRQGFYAGFRATGEGYNGEYPFEGEDIEADEGVIELCEKAFQEWVEIK